MLRRYRFHIPPFPMTNHSRALFFILLFFHNPFPSGAYSSSPGSSLVYQCPMFSYMSPYALNYCGTGSIFHYYVCCEYNPTECCLRLETWAIIGLVLLGLLTVLGCLGCCALCFIIQRSCFAAVVCFIPLNTITMKEGILIHRNCSIVMIGVPPLDTTFENAPSANKTTKSSPQLKSQFIHLAVSSSFISQHTQIKMRAADSSSLSRLYESELLHLDSNKAAAALHKELVSMRRLAFFCVSISVAVTFLGTFLVPFLYNQIQYVHSMAQDEMEFCRSRTTTIWREIGRTERVAGSKQKRQTNERLKCCGCGVGTEGIPGLPGTDGQDGQDGQQGIPGLDSIPFDFPVPSQLQPQQWCFVCEEAVPGPIGPPGKRGPKGRDGIDGAPGADGIAGEQGMIGIHGPHGVPGLPGKQGKPGTPGLWLDMPGSQGPPGSPGPSGLPGAVGLPGESGRPGEDGQPGEVGDPGPSGKRGANGEPGVRGTGGYSGGSGRCDHCPMPRTAPGY
uniref:Nematode cuticle collagen N-terminal domain-containing protein n=1 Tax=Globodera rostochiensis TaxID=31243 RepID=A0A914H3E3_GLORO